MTTKHSKPSIIGLAGKRRSGKNLAFDFLATIDTLHPITTYAFADDLKRDVCNMIGIDREFLEANKEDIRLIMQGLGAYRRKFGGPDFWIKRWQAGVHILKEKVPNMTIAVTDCRYKNELDYLKEQGAFLIRVIPVNRPPRNAYSDEVDSHSSETDLDSVPNNDFDAVLYNDFNDIYSMKKQLEDLFL